MVEEKPNLYRVTPVKLEDCDFLSDDLVSKAKNLGIHTLDKLYNGLIDNFWTPAEIRSRFETDWKYLQKVRDEIENRYDTIYRG